MCTDIEHVTFSGDVRGGNVDNFDSELSTGLSVNTSTNNAASTTATHATPPHWRFNCRASESDQDEASGRVNWQRERERERERDRQRERETDRQTHRQRGSTPPARGLIFLIYVNCWTLFTKWNKREMTVWMQRIANELATALWEFRHSSCRKTTATSNIDAVARGVLEMAEARQKNSVQCKDNGRKELVHKFYVHSHKATAGHWRWRGMQGPEL